VTPLTKFHRKKACKTPEPLPMAADTRNHQQTPGGSQEALGSAKNACFMRVFLIILPVILLFVEHIQNVKM
jgi:hypothetical protein